MNIKENLKSGRLALLATIVCSGMLLIAVLIMPGRSGRFISPLLWMGMIAYGVACLFSKVTWHKAVGLLSLASALASGLFTERIGEVMLYLVASGAWIYEGLALLVVSLMLFHLVPARHVD